MKFKKGKSGNPRGRPKLCNLNINDMATRDSVRAYKLLWKSVQASEPWAMDIFFRYFVKGGQVTSNDNQDRFLNGISNLS
ncbi:MAG: hypothetical protein EBY20_03395 [Alphaproteobacteria bacterium]|nr:hypothetical protein [Alphaproteobacteria bacterium]